MPTIDVLPCVCGAQPVVAPVPGRKMPDLKFRLECPDCDTIGVPMMSKAGAKEEWNKTIRRAATLLIPEDS